jgi:predicted RNA-binding Zn ribbon-like protein
MHKHPSPAAGLALIGGAVCLDFANTVSDHNSEQATDYLANYADLVAWSEHAGILAARAAKELLTQAAQKPGAASTVFRRALVLREAIYRIFTALVAGAMPKTADLDLLSEAMASAYAHAHLVATQNGFAWEWADENSLERMLWSIARSAVELLISSKVDRVSQCSGDTCGWLFIDTSKNHSRRWCAMNDCGNRAKARRHYQRLRGIR